MDLSQVPDPIYAERMMGDGVAIVPDDGTMFSPVNGYVSVVAEDKHAFGFTTDDGLEILVHLGVDSKMQKDCCAVHVKVNDRVQAGDMIAEFNLAELKKSSALRDQALYWGIPGWTAAQWSKDMSISEAKHLVRSSGMRTYLSLRLSRGVDREEWLQEYRASGKKAWGSPFLERSVRTPANPYPLEIPGFSEGRITPQSESSMFVAEAFSRRWKGEPLLDMCCGRGIKTGQLADMMPEAKIEAWDISEGRIRSAEYEMIRMCTRDRVTFYCGDSLRLEPKTEPKAILLDAPCTGSGTWGRHPESKWRITPEMVSDAADLQRKLLDRAVSLVAPGGIVAYSTCSMFREENEKVVASVMARHPELTEVPVERSHKLMSKGKPYGTLIWPGLPWIDGFYLALLVKRK